MDTAQGKPPYAAALAIVAQALGVDAPAVGTTTCRAPYTPTTIGAYGGRDVGRLFAPIRTTAMDSWHRAAGAKFEHVGDWMRAWYYPRAGESLRQAVDREVTAARSGVAIPDAPNLGKLYGRGADDVDFVNRD